MCTAGKMRRAGSATSTLKASDPWAAQYRSTVLRMPDTFSGWKVRPFADPDRAAWPLPNAAIHRRVHELGDVAIEGGNLSHQGRGDKGAISGGGARRHTPVAGPKGAIHFHGHLEGVVEICHGA